MAPTLILDLGYLPDKLNTDPVEKYAPREWRLPNVFTEARPAGWLTAIFQAMILCLCRETLSSRADQIGQRKLAVSLCCELEQPSRRGKTPLSLSALHRLPPVDALVILGQPWPNLPHPLISLRYRFPYCAARMDI